MLTVDEFRAAVKGPLARWNPRTLCPHCQTRLAWQTHLVIPTRHCPECGGRVLADLPDPEDDDPGTRPTVARYKAAAERYLLVVGLTIGGGIVAWLVGMIVGLSITDRMARGGPEVLRVVLGVWSCFGPPVVAVGLIAVWYRRAKRNPAITCPGCGELVTPFAAVVGATGRCHTCGRKFLAERPPDDPDLPPPAGPPLPVAEFAARRNARRRLTRRVIVGFTVWAVLVVAVVVSPLVVIGADDLERALAREVGPGPASATVPVGFVALGLGLMAAGFATAWVTRPHLRRHPLTCPDCGKEFVQFGLVLAGRRCDHCHGLAVADPDFGDAGSAARPAG